MVDSDPGLDPKRLCIQTAKCFASNNKPYFVKIFFFNRHSMAILAEVCGTFGWCILSNQSSGSRRAGKHYAVSERQFSEVDKKKCSKVSGHPTKHSKISKPAPLWLEQFKSGEASAPDSATCSIAKPTNENMKDSWTLFTSVSSTFIV